MNRKNRKEYFQFLIDVSALDRMAELYAPIDKQAGLIESISSLKDTLINDAKKELDEKGLRGALISLFVSGALFKKHWLLGVANEVAKAVGFDISDFLNKMLDFILGAIDSNSTLSYNEASDKAKMLTEQQSGIPLSSLNNYDDLFYIKKLARHESVVLFLNKHHVKTAQKQSLIARLLSFGEDKAKWAVGGIFRVAILSLLTGLGVFAAKSTLKHFTAPSEDERASLSENNKTVPNASQLGQTIITPDKKRTLAPALTLPKGRTHTLKMAPGYRDVYYYNDANTLWSVPLINSDVHLTLLRWAITIYPELKDQEKIMLQLPEFNSLANMLQQYYVPRDSRYAMFMPAGINTHKQLVDYFAGAAQNKIKENKINETKEAA